MKTIEETRLDRLKILIEEVGGIQALADILKISYAQISQWINRSIDKKTGKPRTMNSSSARKAEIACNKPRGWFDQPVVDDTKKFLDALETIRTTPKEIVMAVKHEFPDGGNGENNKKINNQ